MSDKLVEGAETPPFLSMAYYIEKFPSAYRDCYQLQQRLVAARHSGDLEKDLFLFTEHPPVYTLGKNGGAEYFHISDEFLAEKGIGVEQIERGGQVTYHGPGQLVLYPIISLRARKMRVTEYVHALEEVMIRTCASYGMTAVRNPKNAGIWTEDGASKVGSIGIAIRHGVSFHGLALNINPDLEPFSWIAPCGLSGVTATSIAKELGVDVGFKDAYSVMREVVADIFGALSPFTGDLGGGDYGL